MQPAHSPIRVRQVLHGLFDEWRSLTEKETNAIRTGDWNCVTKVQAKKQALREPIEQGVEELETAFARSESEWGEIKAEFRSLIDQLMSLERQNSELVDARMGEAKMQQRDLARSAKSLRQVQRAYSFRNGSAWHSYS